MPCRCPRAICTVLLSCVMLLPLCAAAADNETTRQFHALLADHWDWQAREFPERATVIGDYRFNDRVTDLSATAVAKRKLVHREFLKRLDTLDPAALAGQDSISYAVFAAQRRQQAQLDAIFGDLPFGAQDSYVPVTQLFGPQLNLPALSSLTQNCVACHSAYRLR